MKDKAALKVRLSEYTDPQTSQFFDGVIALCEQRLRRDTRIKGLYLDKTLELTGANAVDGRYALPAGFSGFRSVLVATNEGGYKPVKYKDQIPFWRGYNPSAVQETLLWYTIEGNGAVAYLVFGDVTPTDRTIRLMYREKMPDLVNDTDTNFLLQEHEALYLYGCLVELAPFRREDARALTWAAYYEDAADEYKRLTDFETFSEGDIQRQPSVTAMMVV